MINYFPNGVFFFYLCPDKFKKISDISAWRCKAGSLKPRHAEG